MEDPVTTKQIDRRTLIKTGVGVAGMGVLSGCLGDIVGSNGGEEYPSDDIQITVPHASGGGHDAYARISEEYWRNHLPDDPDLLVENVTGGGGATGITNVYNDAGNGHHLMLTNVYGTVTRQIATDVDFNIAEMNHTGALTQAPNALVIMEPADVSGWSDFIERIDEFNFATNGIGQIGHTGVPLLGELTGRFSENDVQFVHYEGTGEALTGLEQGEADAFLVGDVTSAMRTVESLDDAELFMTFVPPEAMDETRSLFIDEATHVSSDVDEPGLDEYADLTVFRRFFAAPPDVDQSILEIQRETLDQIVADENFLDDAEESGRPVVNPGSAEQIEEQIDQQFDTWESDPLKDTLQNAFNS